MALVNCRECNASVSEHAKSCPHCGIEVPATQTPATQAYVAPAGSFPPEPPTAANMGAVASFAGKALKAFFGAVVIFAGVKIALTFINGGGLTKLIGGPSCQIASVLAEPDVFIINGEADVGVKVTTRIKNTSSAGDLNISVRLSSSEGDWVRTTTRHLQSGEEAAVVINFPEPTINSQNVQAKSTCS